MEKKSRASELTVDEHKKEKEIMKELNAKGFKPLNNKMEDYVRRCEIHEMEADEEPGVVLLFEPYDNNQIE